MIDSGFVDSVADVFNEHGIVVAIVVVLLFSVHKWLPAIVRLWAEAFRTIRNPTEPAPMPGTRGCFLTKEEHDEICRRTVSLIAKDFEIVHTKLGALADMVERTSGEVAAVRGDLGELKSLLLTRIGGD